MAQLTAAAAGIGVTTWQFGTYAPEDPPISAEAAAARWSIGDDAAERHDFLARGDQLARRLDGAEAPAETGVLFLHALDPHGFAVGRRVTESNADLSRNASTNDALYRTVIAGYPRVDAVINPRARERLEAVFEYGAMDSQTTMGSIKSLRLTMLENRRAQFSCAGPGDETKIRRDDREMFNPSSMAWRAKVIADSRAMFGAVMANWPRVLPP